MKKTITMYELLGMVKDGKAPKKIKYENREYYLHDNKSYLSTDKTRFFDRIYFCDLNIEVEILDEEEFEDIDKLDIEDNAMNRSERYIRKSNNTFVTLSVPDYVLANKINQLIKNQKKIISKLGGKND